MIKTGLYQKKWPIRLFHVFHGEHSTEVFASSPEGAYSIVADEVAHAWGRPTDGDLYVKEMNHSRREIGLTYYDLQLIGFIEW